MTPLERDRLAREYAAALLQGSSEDLLSDVAEALEALPTPEPSVGQLWRVAKAEKGCAQALVLLTHTAQVLRGILATEDSWLATSEDILIAPTDSPTGEELMVAIWSDTPVPRQSLAGLLGVVAPAVMAPILMVLQSRLTGGFRLRAVAALSGGGLGTTKWTIQPLAEETQPVAFVTGTRVVDRLDARLDAREAIRDATGWIGRDAIAMVWEIGGAAERVPWHVILLEDIRAAVDRLSDAVIGAPSNGEPSSSTTNTLGLLTGTAFTSAAIAGIGGGVAAVEAGMAHGFPTLGGGVLRAIGTASDSGGPDRILFVLPIGGAKVEVNLEVQPDTISVMVHAREGDRPKKGLPIDIRLSGTARSRSEQRRTDVDGVAFIAQFTVPEGAGIELGLGTGEERHVVKTG